MKSKRAQSLGLNLVIIAAIALVVLILIVVLVVGQGGKLSTGLGSCSVSEGGQCIAVGSESAPPGWSQVGLLGELGCSTEEACFAPPR